MNVANGGRAVGAIVLALFCKQAMAKDDIPYPHSGKYNSTTYAFTAENTGDVVAYFAGTDATYDNELGMLVNGVSTGKIGLDDHTSSIGQSFDLGHANAGDTLTFVLQVNTLKADVYSDPSLNLSYDTSGETLGHNHAYSTEYTATSPIFGSAPAGTFVAFEDERFPSSDFSYNDENFVFSNVAVPEPASEMLGAVALVLIGRRPRRYAK